MSDALTPYAGTSGWSGSSASEDRARTEDADGTTSKRQRAVLDFVARGLTHGVTVKDVGEEFGYHHGQASGALSLLHKEGLISRLTQRRGRCSVYVMPTYVNGRETAEHGRAARVPMNVTVAVGKELDDGEALALARLHKRMEAAEQIGASNILVPTDALTAVVTALEARS